MNLNDNIAGMLPDYFDHSQIKEITQLFHSSQLIDSDLSDTKSADPNDYKLPDGLTYRRQLDLLITYAENKLIKDKFISFLLYLSQASITNGEFTTAIDINEKLISLTSGNDDLIDIAAHTYLLIGEIYTRQAHWQNSFNFIRKAQQLFESLNDLKGVAKCENLLGTLYGDLGDIKNAIQNFEAALSKSTEDTNYNEKGKIEINLGIVNNIRGFFDVALTYFNRALLNFEKIGDKKRIAEIHQNMGMVYTKKKEYHSAIKEFDESLTYSVQTDYIQTIGLVYLSKAYVYSQTGDYSLAIGFADKAMEIAHRLNDKLTVAEVYKIKGIIQRNKKVFTLAENYLLTSLRLNVEAGNQLNQAETYYEIGILYKAMNRADLSEQNFRLALEYFKKINAEEEIAQIEKLISQ